MAISRLTSGWTLTTSIMAFWSGPSSSMTFSSSSVRRIIFPLGSSTKDPPFSSFSSILVVSFFTAFCWSSSASTSEFPRNRP